MNYGTDDDNADRLERFRVDAAISEAEREDERDKEEEPEDCESQPIE